MDLDVRTISVGTLRNHVDRVLAAPPFLQTLRAQQIDIVQSSSPRQTQTTQRWKLVLRSGQAGQQIPTKIEFSRRALGPGVVHEPVDPELIRRYRLYPVLAQHYAAAAAFSQKVLALALRSQTQARDIFDLKLLLDAGAADIRPPGNVLSKLPRAIENAMSIGYDEFAGQVLAYLEPEYQDHYRARRTWNELHEQVVRALEALHA